ncbi:MAG: YopX family protein [Staphylococcus equorum]|nr:YopX family protein [Staphylococcus equorum]
MIPKFRAYLKKHEKVVDVREIDYRCNCIIWMDEKYTEIEGFEDIELLQSTGLKDKNGVEIFEGDVLEIPVAIDTETLNGEVVFEDGIFGIKDVLDGWGFDIGLVPLIEIILAKKVIIVGNIYEHPHLLEGDNE